MPSNYNKPAIPKGYHWKRRATSRFSTGLQVVRCLYAVLSCSCFGQKSALYRAEYGIFWHT